jgi:hypothetical protein
VLRDSAGVSKRSLFGVTTAAIRAVPILCRLVPAFHKSTLSANYRKIAKSIP